MSEVLFDKKKKSRRRKRKQNAKFAMGSYKNCLVMSSQSFAGAGAVSNVSRDILLSVALYY